MHDLISVQSVFAFFKVVFIDIALAGDNAIVIGMAAAGLDVSLRRKAIIVGIGAAMVLRIFFALLAVQLLKLTGLTLAGGLLLLWVCWKLWREVRTQAETEVAGAPPGGAKTLRQAVLQIVVADVSMSIDNVLAVAGAAREHPMILVFGLVLSIGLTAVAANLIVHLLHRFKWIAYVGILIILYVACEMVLSGGMESFHAASAAMAAAG